MPRAAALAFIIVTKSSTVPPAASASAVEASLPDCTRTLERRSRITHLPWKTSGWPTKPTGVASATAEMVISSVRAIVSTATIAVISL